MDYSWVVLVINPRKLTHSNECIPWIFYGNKPPMKNPKCNFHWFTLTGRTPFLHGRFVVIPLDFSPVVLATFQHFTIGNKNFNNALTISKLTAESISGSIKVTN